MSAIKHHFHDAICGLSDDLAATVQRALQVSEVYVSLEGTEAELRQVQSAIAALDRTSTANSVGTDGREASGSEPSLPYDAVALRDDDLAYAQQIATYAANLAGCVPEWRPLDSVSGCLSQIDNCLTGLQALTPMKGEAETVARTFYLARRAATALDIHGVCEVEWDELPDDMKADYLAGARAVLSFLKGEG